MLIDLAKVTETYIPLAPYLFELFNLAEVRSKAKPGTMPSLDWSLIIKAPKEYLHGKVYQVSTVTTRATLLEGKALNF